MNISKSVKLVCYLIFCALFIGWLAISSTVVSNLSPNKLESRKLSDFQQTAMEGFFSIDGVIIDEGSLAENLSMKGWAFLAPEMDDLEIVLISDERAYSVHATPVSRPDVLKAYPQIADQAETDAIGFVADFSTTKMKNGVYSLYICCKETEAKYGLIDTELKFEKKGRVFEEYFFQSDETEILAAEEPISRCTVDGVKTDAANIEVKGWAYLEGLDCAEQEVFVQLTGENGTETFTTESRERADVVKAYGSDSYLESGYLARIPAAELEAGGYALELYVKNGDRIAGTEKGMLQISEDGTATYQAASAVAPVMVFQSEKVEVLNSQDTLENRMVEKVVSSGTVVEIKGWAFLEGMDCAEQEVFVQLTGENGTKTFTTESRERADVAEAYGSDGYLKSGYLARIPAAELEEEAYTLELFVKNGDQLAGFVWGQLVRESQNGFALKP